MKGIILMISILVVCISAGYLDFKDFSRVTAGARVDGDELIHYAFRITPFLADKKDSSFFTEIHYQAPDDVLDITYAWVEIRGVSSINQIVIHILHNDKSFIF